jgi:hypothetical protein
VAGDSLSGFKGAVIFQKICDAGRAFASANTPVLCLVLLLLASQTDGGFRLIRTGLAVTLPVSRLARRSIFILACVLADPAVAEPFTPEASCSAVTSSSHSGYFRLEQQLPGGLSSSHWKSAFFPRPARILGLNANRMPRKKQDDGRPVLYYPGSNCTGNLAK